MQTHTKEAVTTAVTFLAMIGTVHAGIWFRLFGIPDITILNWPFHYFWFVVGSWVSLLVIYLAYNRYASNLDAEKERLRDRHGETVRETSEEPAGEPTAGAGGD